MKSQRIMPTDRQIKTAVELLEKVPALSYDWLSTPGQDFLAYVDGLADRGVPVAWLAEPIGLDAGRLYRVLDRYRKEQVA